MRVNLLMMKCFASDIRTRRFIPTSAAMTDSAMTAVNGNLLRSQNQSLFKYHRRNAWIQHPSELGCCRHHHRDGPHQKLRWFHSTTQLFFSSNNDNDSAAKKHQLYLQQLQELEAERTSLFGSMKDDHDSRSSTTTPDVSSYMNDNTENDMTVSSTIHNDTLQDHSNGSRSINSSHHHDVQDLNADREALYGFTNEERNAWSTIGSSNATNHATMLRDIAYARQQQEEQGECRVTETSITDQTATIELGRSVMVTTTNSTTQSFTHLTQDQKQIHMVDVGPKVPTRRTAIAQSMVIFPPEVLAALNRTEDRQQISDDGIPSTKEWIGPKGPIFATAITAGIMGVKQTSSLIPLCHPLPIENIHIDITWYTSNTIQIKCTCSVTHKTGVEMEALMGCSIAALTIYDMVKAISHNVQITDTKLLYKDGGKRHVDER